MEFLNQTVIQGLVTILARPPRKSNVNMEGDGLLTDKVGICPHANYLSVATLDENGDFVMASSNHVRQSSNNIGEALGWKHYNKRAM